MSASVTGKICTPAGNKSPRQWFTENHGDIGHVAEGYNLFWKTIEVLVIIYTYLLHREGQNGFALTRVALDGGHTFPTTPNCGHQIDITFKIVPHALFVDLHNLIQRSVISRPLVGYRLV